MSFLINTNNIQNHTGVATVGSLAEKIGTLAPKVNPEFTGRLRNVSSSEGLVVEDTGGQFGQMRMVGDALQIYSYKTGTGYLPIVLGMDGGTKAGAVELGSGQLKFPATQSASTDPNTLDDYEEGTWTPTISSDGTAPTVSLYDTRTGYYTKVGNTVHVFCHLRINISNVGSGNPVITGLPFNAISTFAGVSLGISNVLSNTGSMRYISGSSVILSGATYVSGQNNYLTLHATYMPLI